MLFFQCEGHSSQSTQLIFRKQCARFALGASKFASHASMTSRHLTMTSSMMLSLLMTLLLSTLLSVLPHVRAHNNNTEIDDVTCIIRATLYKQPAAERSEEDFGLPMDINCGQQLATSQRSSPLLDLSAQRLAGKAHVSLDGSQTQPLSVASYGLEYLNSCARLLSLQIEHFVADVSWPVECAEHAALEQLNSLTFRYNELGTLSSLTCQHLPHLKTLQLRSNSLRFIETLQGCAQLQQLIISEEQQLLLRDGRFFSQLPKLQHLELRRLQHIAAALFDSLPENLTTLLVQQTPIQEQQLSLSNAARLVNLTMASCELNNFSFRQAAPASLLHLNLSGNALQQLQLTGQDNPLLTLDLSNNQLESLNRTWLKGLKQLQTLLLQQNRLSVLSLTQLLNWAPANLQYIDVRSNLLRRLENAMQMTQRWPPQLWRLHIDGNPWSCQWLLNFTHAQPQIFRLFQYAKYISHINVNGLTCQPEAVTQAALEVDESIEEDFELPESELAYNATRANISSHTILYGHPFEKKRSQRSGALIIVFMLPLGIALLFLLLYMYLHCERLFHLSYYMAHVHCFGGNKSNTPHRFVDQVDIVRYPSVNGNGATAVDVEQEPDGYETPLTGGASICNCTQRQSQSTCSRSHHVTYEALPNELPYSVYAEIKDPPESGAEALAAATAPIYDHLSFEEVSTLEV